MAGVKFFFSASLLFFQSKSIRKEFCYACLELIISEVGPEAGRGAEAYEARSLADPLKENAKPNLTFRGPLVFLRMQRRLVLSTLGLLKRIPDGTVRYFKL
jgi:hypothetical protein